MLEGGFTSSDGKSSYFSIRISQHYNDFAKWGCEPNFHFLKEGGDPESLVKKKKTKRMRTTFTEEQIQILQVAD